MERWADIRGYEGYYEISDLGRVFSVRRNILMKTKILKGYCFVELNVDCKAKLCTVHRLVCKAFVVNHENKPEINHKDGNKGNNYYKNLEFVTSSENKLHAYRTGLYAPMRGEKSPLSKLSEEDVIKIRSMHAQGVTTSKISKHFNVGKHQIWRIYTGKSWSHILLQQSDR